MKATSSIHEACKAIGRELYSTDRFVCEAIEWLLQEDEKTEEYTKQLTIQGDARLGWSVCFQDISSGGVSLADALVGVVLAKGIK